jgi:hypothetical protein
LPSNLTGLPAAAQPEMTIDPSPTAVEEPVEQETPAPTPTPVPTLAPSTEFDGVGVSSEALFEALPDPYFYAYHTLIVDDGGQPHSEMRFFGNRYFLLVTKLAGGESDRVVPGSGTIQVDGLSASITPGLSGVVRLDTSTLQDGVERPVLGELSGDDGLIGGERDYPAELAYDDGLVLGFALDDVAYALLTNLAEDQAIWIVQQMRQIVSGGEAGPGEVVLTATPTPIPPPASSPDQAAQLRFLTIQSALARETYYAYGMMTGEIEGGDNVREARFYGNHRFFVLTEWPDGDPERLEGEPIELGGYPAALLEGLSGTLNLDQPYVLQDGTPLIAGGGGGGGYDPDGTHEWLGSIDYENGLRLTWVADGVRYMALTNNSRDDLLAFADAVNRVVSGQVPVTVPGFPEGFPLPDESAEAPLPGSEPAIFYDGPQGTLGISMGALAFTPLRMHYLPPAVIPGLGYPERGDAGDWVQFVARSPDTGAMAVIRQSVDSGEGLPGASNLTLNGAAGYLEENVACAVDVPDYSNPVELGSSGGGGGGNSNTLPRLTFDCAEPSARYVTVIEGVRVEVIVSGLDTQELVNIVEGLYPAD